MGTPPPDPTNPDLLTSIRSYLIAQGLVRDPRDGTKPNLPVLWIDPRHGTPAPGQKEGLSSVEQSDVMHVAIYPETDIPPSRFESFIRTNTVTFTYRARTSQPILSLSNSIWAVLNDKRGWVMDLVEVNESLRIRGLQPIDRTNIAYTYQEEYSFVLWAPFAVVG